MPGEATPLVPSESSSSACGTRTVTISAIASLVAIAVVKVQLTAYIFELAKYPTFYSFYSCIVTVGLLLLAFIVMPNQWSLPKKEMFLGPHYALTLVVLFNTFDLAFTNIALASISITLQQCIAATNPFWTLLIEAMLYGKCQHPIVYGAVLGTVAGTVLAVAAAEGDEQQTVSALGVVAAAVATLCSASRYAFTHAAFVEFEGQMSPLSLLFWVDLLMLPIYVPWICINGSAAAVFTSGMMRSQDWICFTGTAALGGVRALTQYFVLNLVAATSMSTANIFTIVLNILISMTWQPISVSPALVGGIVLVVAATALYAYLKSERERSCCGVTVVNDEGDGAPCESERAESGRGREPSMLAPVPVPVPGPVPVSRERQQ